MNSICAIILIFLFVVSGKKISEFCVHEHEKVMRCRCTGNEELFLPPNINFENLTSLHITSCTSVYVYSLSLGNARMIRDIIIQNISDSLTFEPHVFSEKINKLQLNNIGRIPIIDHDTFTSISSIESFTIENARIDEFDEQFTSIDINLFILRNVIIDHSVGINFSNRGKTLEIINSTIRNVYGNLNFAFFESIQIINSTFEFGKPGDMAIEGYNVLIADCVFTNVSMNLVAQGNAVIKGNCADGKSSLRVSSTYVHSNGNKLPTEIIYTEKVTKSMMFHNENNTVCIAGDCKCPKSIVHNSYYKLHANVDLGIVLLLLLHGL